MLQQDIAKQGRYRQGWYLKAAQRKQTTMHVPSLSLMRNELRVAASCELNVVNERCCVMIGREFFFAVGSFCFCHHVLVPLFALEPLEQRQKHDESDADDAMIHVLVHCTVLVRVESTCRSMCITIRSLSRSTLPKNAHFPGVRRVQLGTYYRYFTAHTCTYSSGIPIYPYMYAS